MTRDIPDEIDRRLALVGSEDRAGVLVEVLDGIDDAALANLVLVEWFNCCDAIGDHAPALRRHFVRAGFVTDADDVPTLPLRIYRAGWADTDPRAGLSWTTSLDSAKWFANYLTGVRAWFLGIRRDDVDPVVWSAVCYSALGYITGRNEHEIIPDDLGRIEVWEVLTTTTTDGG